MADPLQDVQAAVQRAIDDRATQADTAAAMRQIGAVIGTAVRAMMDRAESAAAGQVAMRDTLQQLSASAADIVALMEAGQADDGPEETQAQKRAKHEAEAKMKAQAMADALGPMLGALQLPAPRVQVDVQPAVVTVPQPRVDVTVQPAADKAGQQWRIEIERVGKNPAAAISALIVTKL